MTFFGVSSKVSESQTGEKKLRLKKDATTSSRKKKGIMGEWQGREKRKN